MGEHDADWRRVPGSNVTGVAWPVSSDERKLNSQVSAGSLLGLAFSKLSIEYKPQPIISRPLLGALGRKYEQYLDFAQQDAHEFLRILLDATRMEEFDVSCRHLYENGPGSTQY